MVDLRSYVFLDNIQPQYAAFLGTVAQGFLPVAGMASLYVEIFAGHRDQPHHRHRAEEHARDAGHADRRAVVRHAGDSLRVAGGRAAGGAGDLDALELTEEDRTKPRIASSQVIRRVDDHQTQLVNRMRHGNMIIAGQTLYVMEVEPAGYAALAANEAEKAAEINILEVRVFGSFGTDVSRWRGTRHRGRPQGAAIQAIEGVTGRSRPGNSSGTSRQWNTTGCPNAGALPLQRREIEVPQCGCPTSSEERNRGAPTRVPHLFRGGKSRCPNAGAPPLQRWELEQISVAKVACALK
jgi:hypothetical protein